MNLLEETKNILKQNGKEPKDVLWVGDTTLWFSWEYFISIADRRYDSGFGKREILAELLVVGNNWWLERHEYAGSEWWEYKSLPIKPSKEYNIETIFVMDYEDKNMYVECDTFEEILKKVNKEE